MNCFKYEKDVFLSILKLLPIRKIPGSKTIKTMFGNLAKTERLNKQAESIKAIGDWFFK